MTPTGTNVSENNLGFQGLRFEIKCLKLPLTTNSSLTYPRKQTNNEDLPIPRLFTSYLPLGGDVSNIFKAFERFCPRVPSCQIWL